MKLPTPLASILLLLGLCAQVRSAQPSQYLQIQRTALSYSAVQPRQQAVAAVVVRIADGFHAQSHTPSDPDYVPFVVTLDSNPSLKFYATVYPPGQNETYPNIDPAKPLNVYTGQVRIYIPFEAKPDAAAGPLTISGKIEFQACDARACYPPTSAPFRIQTQIIPIGQVVASENADLFKDLQLAKLFVGATPTAAAAPASASAAAPQKLIGGFELRNNSYILAFIAAFIAGIIFNAVPCVLPVLPLKAIGFYEVSQHNRAKSIAFGAVFSLGLIASFGVLALFIVVKKVVGWGEIYSNVYFNLAIVAILLAMAIGTFGVFTVNLPTAVYNVTPRHDTYFGNFLFGILTAILSTPCTFGLFLGLLVWAAAQPWYVGMPLVMTVGAGMASPYFVLSAFPELARRFPRTGPWSELVKQLMAFLLLGSAIFFARRFIAPVVGADAFWWVLFAVAVLAGGFLVIRSIQIAPRLRPTIVSGFIAIVMVGLTLWVVLQVVNQPYTWASYQPAELRSARDSGRVVVIDFTAAWCSTCQYLESTTLHDPRVVKAVKASDATMLKADLTRDDAAGWPLLKQLSPVAAIPFTVVYGPGTEKPQTLEGLYSPENLIAAIERAKK